MSRQVFQLVKSNLFSPKTLTRAIFQLSTTKMGQSSSTPANPKTKEEEKRATISEDLAKQPFFSLIDAFKSSFEGTVLIPQDGGPYLEARRRAFNQDQRGFPFIIARAANAEDVAKCFEFYNKNGRDSMRLCIACGCHSSRCMIDRAFIIDLKNISSASVDLERMTATVGGGSYLKVLDDAMKPHGVGTTVGTYPETGVGGLTLGGGFGWLARIHGFVVDNFIEAEVVLPDGRIVIANETNEHSDLLFALRGGGGNFGVVTKFTFRVYKLPSHCYAGAVVYLAPTVSSAVGVLLNFDKLAQKMPNAMAGGIVLPAGAPVIPTTWAYMGEETAIAQIPTFAEASKLGGWFTVERSIKEMDYHSGLQTMLTPHQTSGHIYQSIIQIGSLNEPLSASCWEELATYTKASLPAAMEKAVVVLMYIGGEAATRDDGSKTCMPQVFRQGRYFGIIESYWKPSYGDAGKEAAKKWTKGVYALMSKYRTVPMIYAPDEINSGAPAVHSSAATPEECPGAGPAGIEFWGFSESIYQRLRQIKTKYDPQNVLKENMNIPPL